MSGKKIKYIFETFKVVVLVTLLGVLALSTAYNYHTWKSLRHTPEANYVLVEGNVSKPGYYKAGPYSTNLDILKEAGLNDSSNIKHINLVNVTDPKTSLEVGVSKVKVVPKLFSGFQQPKLAYFKGNVALKRELKIRKVKMNQKLLEKDILYTKVNGKAKIIFRNQSEISVNSKTKLRIDHIGSESPSSNTRIRLGAGKINITTPRTEKGSKLILITPTVKLEFGQEVSNVLVSIQGLETTISPITGKIFGIPLGGGEKRLIEKGQMVIARQGGSWENVDNKTSLAKSTLESFKELEKSYKGFKKSQKEVNLLLTTGSFNLVLSLIPEKRRVVFMDLPSNTYVGDYISGVLRLDQALAMAGSEITRGIVERIIGRPIEYVAQVGLQNLMGFAYAIDGIMVDVDPSAALVMKITPGLQRLSQQQIISFLNPAVPGGESAAIRRQKKVFLAFFKRVREGNVAVYSNVIADLVKSMSTNMSPKDAIKLFKVFAEKEHWSVVNISMPSQTFEIGPIVMVRPRYQEIKRLYQ